MLINGVKYMLNEHCWEILIVYISTYMQEGGRSTTQSLIAHQEKQPNIAIRILTIVDIFAFLPVPRDKPVSTKQSIVGSIIFLVIFLSYVIFDFVKFVQYNNPIQQTYRQPLDDQSYVLPDFAIAFMTTKESKDINNYTQTYDNLFSYTWETLVKSLDDQPKQPIAYDMVTYQNGSSFNFDKINWMNDKTKQFYYILRTPIRKNLTTHGLLYTSPQTQYVRIKAYFCRNDSNITCLSPEQMIQLSNYGRFFLFIEDQADNSTLSLETDFLKDNRFLLYNFFVIPNFYKRITIKFEVVKTQILPDYFFRFSNEYSLRMHVQSVFQQVSVVNSGNASATDAIAFNMQLSPYVLHNRISCSTIIDHISLWGAFFGVLFSAFAFLFLSFNRKKFYNKNPDWSNFKEALNKGRLDPRLQ